MAKTRNRKDWAERIARVKEDYPSIDQLDWEKAFRQDPGLMANILHDILERDAYEIAMEEGAYAAGGRKPNLTSTGQTETRLRQFRGEDHTTLVFAEAFTLMIGDMRLSTLARKVGMSKTQVWRLLRAQAQPSSEEMEKIAQAFRRHPSYFAEYRMGWVLGVLARRLENLPEATVGFYKRLAEQ